MKHFLLILFVLLGVQQLYGQDVIVLKNGNKVEAKVIEISSTQIKYRLYTQPEGPDRIIEVFKVEEIIYEDGQFDTFESSSAKTSSSTSKEEPVKEDFFKKRTSIEGIVGVSFTTYSYETYLYDENYNYIYSTQTEQVQFIQVGFKLGTNKYFGSNEKFRSGFKINWVRLGIHIDPTDEESIIAGPRTIGVCNLGYTGLLKLNDKSGMEFNFVTGFGVNGWIGEGFLEAGLNFTPEVKINLNKLLLGLEYTHFMGIEAEGGSPSRFNMAGLSIGVKF